MCRAGTTSRAWSSSRRSKRSKRRLTPQPITPIRVSFLTNRIRAKVRRTSKLDRALWPKALQASRIKNKSKCSKAMLRMRAAQALKGTATIRGPSSSSRSSSSTRASTLPWATLVATSCSRMEARRLTSPLPAASSSSSTASTQSQETWDARVSPRSTKTLSLCRRSRLMARHSPPRSNSNKVL